MSENQKQISSICDMMDFFASGSWDWDNSKRDDDEVYIINAVMWPNVTVERFKDTIESFGVDCSHAKVGITTYYKHVLDPLKILEEPISKYCIHCSWNGYILKNHLCCVLKKICMSVVVDKNGNQTIEKCVLMIDRTPILRQPCVGIGPASDEDTQTAVHLLQSDIDTINEHIKLYLPDYTDTTHALFCLGNLITHLNNSLSNYARNHPRNYGFDKDEYEPEYDADDLWGYCEVDADDISDEMSDS